MDWRILIFALVIAQLLTSCASSVKQEYENSDLGIPNNWDVKYHERSGSIIFETRKRTGSLDSARVEIQGNACSPVPSWFNGASKAIESDIDRIRALYNLDSINTIEKPIKIEGGINEVVRAIIAVLTMSMPKNDNRNQIDRASLFL